MSHEWQAVLNNTAYSLLGGMLVIGYYQGMAWWRERRDQPVLKKMTPTGFFGTMLILLAVITTLFNAKRDAQDNAYRSCQANILQHNVEVQNDRVRNYNKSVRRFNASINAQYSYIRQFQVLVHEGQHKHADPKKILASYDHDVAVVLRSLTKAKQQPSTSKLKFITACGTPPK